MGDQIHHVPQLWLYYSHNQNLLLYFCSGPIRRCVSHLQYCFSVTSSLRKEAGSCVKMWAVFSMSTWCNTQKTTVKQTIFCLLNSGCTLAVHVLFDRFVNLEPSAFEEVSQEQDGMSEASLRNSSMDGKILSTEVGSSIHTVEEESTKLRITNVSESKCRLTPG